MGIGYGAFYKVEEETIIIENSSNIGESYLEFSFNKNIIKIKMKKIIS